MAKVSTPKVVLKTFAGRIVYKMRSGDFSKKIIDWYLTHQRDLPWRKGKSPYRIWLSEIILQQTRVAQGLPYYYRFIKEFPNVDALAKAPQQKVLRAWQGLGYYSRARNLHACAKKISNTRGGAFPNTYDDLIGLPGVGPYTAAAIASMAFDEPKALADGNVYRVLARIFGIENDIASSGGRQVFMSKANELIDQTRPGIFNQAVMEFGALCCTPKKPACDSCIFSTQCFARKHEMINNLPFKSKRPKIRQRYFNYFVFLSGKKIAMRKRTEKDIWNGLFDFYLYEGAKNRKLEQMAKQSKVLAGLLKGMKCESKAKIIKHVLTHQTIYARFFVCEARLPFAGNAVFKGSGLNFYSFKKVAQLPKPALITRFLNEMGILE